VVGVAGRVVVASRRSGSGGGEVSTPYSLGISRHWQIQRVRSRWHALQVVDVARAVVRAAMREYAFGETYQLGKLLDTFMLGVVFGYFGLTRVNFFAGLFSCCFLLSAAFFCVVFGFSGCFHKCPWEKKFYSHLCFFCENYKHQNNLRVVFFGNFLPAQKNNNECSNTI